MTCSISLNYTDYHRVPQSGIPLQRGAIFPYFSPVFASCLYKMGRQRTTYVPKRADMPEITNFKQKRIVLRTTLSAAMLANRRGLFAYHARNHDPDLVVDGLGIRKVVAGHPGNDRG